MTRISPYFVLGGYVAAVVLYAVLFCSVPGLLDQELSFPDSLYFSVVTITTLGYGDISPVTGMGKFLCASEALVGVLLLGWFLMTVSNQLVYRQERNRIEAAKENLKTQYEFWREDTITALYFLANPNSSLDHTMRENLKDVDFLRKYFTENQNQRWYAIANRLSSDDYYSLELVNYIESLHRAIDSFIAVAPISDSETIKVLTNYTVGLQRLKRLNIDDYDDQKGFLRELWGIIAQSSFATGFQKSDHFLDTVNSV